MVADRSAPALQETVRVLRAGGILAAAFVTRTAVPRFVAKERAEQILELFQPMLGFIVDGSDTLFTPADDDHLQAHFTHPSEVKALLEQAGLISVALYAVEGFDAGSKQWSSRRSRLRSS